MYKFLLDLVCTILILFKLLDFRKKICQHTANIIPFLSCFVHLSTKGPMTMSSDSVAGFVYAAGKKKLDATALSVVILTSCSGSRISGVTCDCLKWVLTVKEVMWPCLLNTVSGKSCKADKYFTKAARPYKVHKVGQFCKAGQYFTKSAIL